MNRLPVVKQFLKGGEAESYEGISINWVRGTRPVLAIFEDGVKKEEVQLADYDNNDKLHALFKDKGFFKKEGVGQSGKTVSELSKSAAAKSANKLVADREKVERIQAKTETKTVTRLGEQGDVVAVDEDFLESSPVHGFGLATGVIASGFALYYVANTRRKTARSVQ